MNRKLFAPLLLGGLLVCLTLTAPADEKKPDDKKPDQKKPDDKKPDDKKPEADGGLIIVDSKGKENKIKGWEITAGTRRLTWLAPPPPPDEKKPDDKDDPNAPKKPVRPATNPNRGPEALAVRDENSTGWVDGILTLVPIERLRGIDYDNEAETVTVKVAGAKADDTISLTGTTKYARINKLTIEAEVDKGELGIASVKYLGGVKTGIKGIRFPSPKSADAPKGRGASVTIQLDKTKKHTDKVTDLQALYLTGGGEIASPVLMFKKTIKLNVAKAKKLVVGDEGKEWTVTLKDGTEETLTLLDQGELDGKTVRLSGLVAKVPAGWKLFPLHTVTEIEFEDGSDVKTEK